MKKPIYVALLTITISLIIALVVILQAGGDPLALAQLGSRYDSGVQGGTEGYDGQFVYYIAHNLDPVEVQAKLDVPAYRYQRILLPILARLLSFNRLKIIPWMIIIINLLAHGLGTWGLAVLLKVRGKNPFYAVYYGLWAGSLLAVRLDLTEPLAFALVIMGMLAGEYGKEFLKWGLFGLALFAKEVVIIFVAAQAVIYLLNKDWCNLGGLIGVTILPFLGFQLWLYQVFGEWGIKSGGEMATGFEWLPFQGLFRIGQVSPWVLAGFLVVFGPFIVYPALAGVWYSGKKIIAQKNRLNFSTAAYGLHGILFLFLPFSTYREPGGLLRMANGLILGLILYVSENDRPKFIKYLPLTLVLNAFLLEV